MDVNYNPANVGDKNLSGGKSPNETKTIPKLGRSKPNLSYSNFITARFGDITPFFVMHCLPDDTIPLQNNFELRSFTLKSPMLSTLRMHKSYFSVPMDAILPRTWEYIYNNPTQGTDVPADAICYTNRILELGKACLHVLSNPIGISIDLLLKYYFLAESIFSSGSLANYLGFGIEASVAISDDYTRENSYTFERFSREFLSRFKDCIDASGQSFSFEWSQDEDVLFVPALDLSTFRHYINKLRENPSFALSNRSPELEYFDSLHSFLEDSRFLTRWVNYDVTTSSPCDFNFDSIAAYQLAVAEFYTNDFVDSVYSAALYRNNLEAVINTVRTYTTGGSLDFFPYNGIQVLYDAFSGHYFDDIAGSFIDNIVQEYSQPDSIFVYFSLILGWRTSLKFTDYFTSSKTRPLAVGNVSAAVVNNEVSAVDMTHRIQMQRFLNSVQRTGRRYASYLKGIFGTELPPDRHEPKFIASSFDSVSGFDVENTTDIDSGKQVSLLSTRGGKYEFTMDSDIPCVVLGLLHFDVIRAYSDQVSKFFGHKDRFDMFNPFLQFIGDQDLKRYEFNSHSYASGTAFNPFGYQVRYCEYKQRPSQAHGGFTNDILPSWAFVNDWILNTPTVLDSDSIRSTSQEFDRFYSSLTGFTLCEYFHFIVSVNNVCEPLRRMELKPNIL